MAVPVRRQVGDWELGYLQEYPVSMGGHPVDIDLSIPHICQRSSGGAKDRWGGDPTHGEAKEEQHHRFVTWGCEEEDTIFLMPLRLTGIKVSQFLCTLLKLIVSTLHT